MRSLFVAVSFWSVLLLANFICLDTALANASVCENALHQFSETSFRQNSKIDLSTDERSKFYDLSVRHSRNELSETEKIIHGEFLIRMFGSKDDQEIKMDGKYPTLIYRPSYRITESHELNELIESSGFKLGIHSALPSEVFKIDWENKVIWSNGRERWGFIHQLFDEKNLSTFLKYSQAFKNNTALPSVPWAQMNFTLELSIKALRAGLNNAISYDYVDNKTSIRVLPTGDHKMNKIAKSLEKNYQAKLMFEYLTNAGGLYKPAENAVVLGEAAFLTAMKGEVPSTLLHEIRHMAYRRLAKKRGGHFLDSPYPWLNFSLRGNGKDNILLKDTVYSDWFAGDEITSHLNDLTFMLNKNFRENIKLVRLMNRARIIKTEIEEAKIRMTTVEKYLSGLGVFDKTFSQAGKAYKIELEALAKKIPTLEEESVVLDAKLSTFKPENVKKFKLNPVLYLPEGASSKMWYIQAFLFQTYSKMKSFADGGYKITRGYGKILLTNDNYILSLQVSEVAAKSMTETEIHQLIVKIKEKAEANWHHLDKATKAMGEYKGSAENIEALEKMISHISDLQRDVKDSSAMISEGINLREFLEESVE